MYNFVKAIYAYSSLCIPISNKTTDWFEFITGGKRGCKIFPTLFSVFDDFVSEANILGLGLDVENRKLPMLLYADDKVLLADSEEKLKLMLDAVSDWCTYQC